MIITNQNFSVIKKAVLTNDQGDLTLGEAATVKVYRVLRNDTGVTSINTVDRKFDSQGNYSRNDPRLSPCKVRYLFLET
jgi:hypothetical protein